MIADRSLMAPGELTPRGGCHRPEGRDAAWLKTSLCLARSSMAAATAGSSTSAATNAAGRRPWDATGRRQVPLEDLEQAAKDPDHEKRVAAEIEEVVVRPRPCRHQYLLPLARSAALCRCEGRSFPSATNGGRFLRSPCRSASGARRQASRGRGTMYSATLCVGNRAEPG